MNASNLQATSIWSNRRLCMLDYIYLLFVSGDDKHIMLIKHSSEEKYDYNIRFIEDT